MKAAILAIGSELVTGRTIDTNSAHICATLKGIGIKVSCIYEVDDELIEIAETFARLAQKNDIVISTGGLGPTFDDLTREALASALGVELVEDAHALVHIRNRLASRKMEHLFELNRKQATLPKGATVIPNPIGSAPGMEARLGDCTVFCLPGVPAEMRAMLADHILPILSSSKTAGSRVAYRFFGLPEAVLGESLPSLREETGLEFAINADGGVITVWVYGKAQDVDRWREHIASRLREKYGDALFGAEEDSLASVVLATAVHKKLTVGTVESCTGGLVAKLLTDVPGSSKVFRGGYVPYSNDLKGHLGVNVASLVSYGAVSEQVAGELAESGRCNLNADIVVSTTGIAGPDGGSKAKPVGLVFIGVASQNKTTITQKSYFGNRTMNRVYFANAALNALRLALLEY